MAYRIGIIGGTGYTGGELARLLCVHPDVEIAAMTSRSAAGRKVSDVLGFLKGYVGIDFTADISETPDLDLVFAATPYGVAMKEVPKARATGAKCIDLSGDYRLGDPELYGKWYGAEHLDPDGLKKAVYGLPELFRGKIKGADLVANPGCFATTAILASAPLLKSGLVEDDVIVDGKSGTSGAGMNPSARLHHPNCGAAIAPYKVGSHRHQPEIAMACGMYAGREPEVAFVPELLPIVRGMMDACFFTLKKETSDEEVAEVYRRQYAGEKFVRYADEARIRDVVGSNHAEVSSKVIGRKAVSFCALDNLVKGASGQAIQNMNLMLGLDEAEGLDFPGAGVRT